MSDKLKNHNYNDISATILADSENEFGNRVTTFVLTFPRIVAAEFNTHKMLSKNSASSRAIPHKRMIKSVIENPFIPKKWMKNHSGMQGNEFITDDKEIQIRTGEWLKARDCAIEQANKLNNLDVSKQFTNRLLEPFLWHTIICSGTEFDNFFALRAHQDAEIHIQELAYKMLDVYNDSRPSKLVGGQWHTPFAELETIDFDRLKELESYIIREEKDIFDNFKHLGIENWLRVIISCARCARVSYLNFEGKDDYIEDFKLYKRLLLSNPRHASPGEHSCKAMNSLEYHYEYMFYESSFTYYGRCRNFVGFIQHRCDISNDTVYDDNRVLKTRTSISR